MDLLSDFKREVSRRTAPAGGPVPLQPRLHPDRPRRHRPLDLRGRGDPQPPGERRAARADPRARLAVPPHQGARCAVSCSRRSASARPAAACRIEDHTPAGTRRDEDAVQEIVARYARGWTARDWDQVRALFWRNGTYSGPLIPRSAGNALPIDSALRVIARTVEGPEAGTFQVRVLRTDLRQEGDLAAVWVTLRRRTPLPGAGSSSATGWSTSCSGGSDPTGGSSAWRARRCREEVLVIPDDRSALALGRHRSPS